MISTTYLKEVRNVYILELISQHNTYMSLLCVVFGVRSRILSNINTLCNRFTVNFSILFCAQISNFHNQKVKDPMPKIK